MADLYPAFQNAMLQSSVPPFSAVNPIMQLLKYFQPQARDLLPFASLAAKDPSQLGAAMAKSGVDMPAGFAATQPVDVGAALNGAPTPTPVQTTDVGPAPIEGEQTVPVNTAGEAAPLTGWDATTTPAGSTGLGSKMGSVLGAGVKLLEPPSQPTLRHASIDYPRLTQAEASFAPAPGGSGARVDLPSAPSMPSPPHPASAARSAANIQQLLQKAIPPKAQAAATLSSLLARRS